MKAVLCTKHGTPTELSISEIPPLVPGENELVVSVKAAAVNFPDVLMIQNKYQHQPDLPFVPGYEFSGVVKAVGENVQGINIGEAGVAIVRSGGFAEEALVTADRFWKIPAGIDFSVAAALPLAYGTSYHALKDRGQLKAGETLLVLGAAGGVGLAAVQLGKLMGAKVIAVASSAEKLATCKRHGADFVINYKEQNLRDAIKELTNNEGVDVILDPVGGEFAEPAIRSMKWFGRYLVVGFTAGSIPKIPMNLPLLKGCSIVGVAWDTYSRKNPVGGKKNVTEMIDWIKDGKLKPVISATYPLSKAPQALDDVMQRRVHGKVIIVP